MAKKQYDEKEYNRLKSRKWSNETQQEDCRNEINTLDGQIAQLRSAYTTIDDAKEAIGEIRTCHSNLPIYYESQWKGGKARYFYDLCESGELKTNYTGYISNIDEAEDAINWKIHELECQKNETYGILSGLADAWDSLCTKIQNFFN